MKKIFCRIGTKTDIADKIIASFPPNYPQLTYVEPFVGSGAVYWAKKPSVEEILGDADVELIESYKNIKKVNLRSINPQQLLELDERIKDMGLDELNTLYEDLGRPNSTPLERLIQSIMRYCFTFSNRGR